MLDLNLPWIFSPPENYNVLKNTEGYPYFVHKLATITQYTKVGRFSYIHGKSRFNGDKEIVIGNFCSIANDVRIQVGDEHDYKHISTFPFQTIIGMKNISFPLVRGEGVIIGNDVWIGEGARILSGSIIGDGAVVGAGSIVRGKLEPYGVYSGNPITLRRMRCGISAISKLMEIKWWNWDLEKILANNNFFSITLDQLQLMDLDDIYETII
jgi:acetyltransferase-like isoleucine patch superfamily enzyme